MEDGIKAKQEKLVEVREEHGLKNRRKHTKTAQMRGRRLL